MGTCIMIYCVCISTCILIIVLFIPYSSNTDVSNYKILDK
jgi:hypothetical protein